VNLIKTIGSCGIVFDTEDHSGLGNDRATVRVECTAHLILNRYCVDKYGHICLTPSLPLSELQGPLELLKAELDSLLEQGKTQFRNTQQAA